MGGFLYAELCWRGGRHYSDRLCSDRCYSDNPQSGRPQSASLARCRNSRNWEKIEGGWGVTCIESTAFIEAPRGVGPGNRGYPGAVWAAPPPEKLQRTSKAPTQLYCPWFSGFGSTYFQSVLPAGLFNCSQPPDVDVLTADCRNNVCRNRVCRNNVVYPCWSTDCVDRNMAGASASSVVDEPTQKPRKPCNCTKSRCLKLYAVHSFIRCCSFLTRPVCSSLLLVIPRILFLIAPTV